MEGRTDRDVLKKNLARIFETTRFNHGLTQEQMANTIGLSQGSISKIESAEITLSTPEFIVFSLHFGISIDEIKFGHVDTKKKATHEVRRIQKFHKLPKQYSFLPSTNMRFLITLIHNIFEFEGEVQFFDISRKLFKIKPNYFYFLDNQINMKFAFDLVTEIQNTQDQDIEKILFNRKSMSPLVYDSFTEHYSKITNGMRILNSFIKNQEHYNVDFNRSFKQTGDDEAILTLRPSKEFLALIKDGHEEWFTFSLRYNFYFLEYLLSFDRLNHFEVVHLDFENY